MTGILEFKNREAWLEARRKFLTASDVGPVLGLSPRRSALAVYAEKVGALDPPEETERMRWGRLLQPILGHEFERETGRRVTDAGEFVLRIHPDLPWLAATLDFLWEASAGRHGVLETKCSEVEWGEEPPLESQAQLQAQLAVTGLKLGSLAGLFRGHKFLWQDQARDEGFLSAALPALDRFWWHVKKGKPPEVVSAKGGTLEALTALYPKNKRPEAIGLPGWADELGLEWDRTKAAVKAAQERLDDIEALIKGEMGDATGAALPDGSGWTWKAHMRQEPAREAREIPVRRFLRWKIA